MDGYTELFDQRRYARRYRGRLLGKLAIPFLGFAALFLIAGDQAGTGEKIIGWAILILGLATVFWVLSTKYRCPRCGGVMHVKKKNRKGAGGAEMFLACDRCMVFIDLQVQEGD